MPIVNWTDFFKDEKDVYIQNVANAQVSLEFEIAPGHIQGFLVPHSRDPFNLTQHIPFHAIRNSAAFRRMLNRRPPALQLLSEEEFKVYYQKRAHAAGQPSWEHAMDDAEKKRSGYQDKTAVIPGPKPEPIHEVVSDDAHFGGKKEVRSNQTVAEDEIIHPKVLHLCLQVDTQLSEKDRMKASVLLDELQTLESELKLDDFEYIRARGYWKSVKNWAKQKIAASAETPGEGAEDDVTSASP